LDLGDVSANIAVQMHIITLLTIKWCSRFNNVFTYILVSLKYIIFILGNQ